MANYYYGNELGQEISYAIGDLLSSYPLDDRPFILGILSAIVSARTAILRDDERKVYELAVKTSHIVFCPPELDPRKKE